MKNPPKKWEYQEEKPEEDLSDIFGQEAAKRAAVIAAAGFHNLLLIGSRGAGKTMIASRIPGIFPGLSREEGMEVSGIYSAAGLLSSTKPVLKNVLSARRITPFPPQRWQEEGEFRGREKLLWHIRRPFFR